MLLAGISYFFGCYDFLIKFYICFIYCCACFSSHQIYRVWKGENFNKYMQLSTSTEITSHKKKWDTWKLGGFYEKVWAFAMQWGGRLRELLLSALLGEVLEKPEQSLPSGLATICQVAITLGSGHCAICFIYSISWTTLSIIMFFFSILKMRKLRIQMHN